ncbi:chromosomal replication initiator protein DnaA [Kaustia mangrovi]|uniref:Chromosomal replication initiator protein DnaA n=1 Tax=Kaustia mangrovi TaxID=2593653 RepID=A0A7S8C4X1_9HYPH|nr:chromosomal replication initiator protein DnaA [Kaustia mangrovi]
MEGAGGQTDPARTVAPVLRHPAIAGEARLDRSVREQQEGSHRVLSENKATGQLTDHWARISDRLRAELGEDLYSSWFARMDVEERAENRLVVSVPTRFLRNWIQSHYLDKLVSLADQEFGGIDAVQIRVRPRGVPMRGRDGGQEAHGNGVEESGFAEAASGTIAPAATATEPSAAGTAGLDGGERGSPLDHTLTFETFIVGKSNALAHAAGLRVADAAPRAPVSFNPLYIHSASGLGKTHLLNAISWRIRKTNPERRVLYLTAERFMYHFISALRARDVISFKDHFQSVDVLLIDDLQFLQGKSMQQEFCHTFTSLVDAKRQVVVAADVPPAQLDSIDARMRSRLAGGLVVDIEAPGLELKRDILRTRLAEARKRDRSIDISEEVLEFIANRINGGGRELEGALIRVMVDQQVARGPMTVDMAALALRDLVQPNEVQRVKIDDIMRVVGRHYNVAKADLLSPRRARSIVRPRQVGMYLAKRLTARSLPEIGRRFGGRDHSTVLHAVRKVEDLMQKDDQLQREVGLLIRLLEQP